MPNTNFHYNFHIYPKRFYQLWNCDHTKSAYCKIPNCTRTIFRGQFHCNVCCAAELTIFSVIYSIYPSRVLSNLFSELWELKIVENDEICSKQCCRTQQGGRLLSALFVELCVVDSTPRLPCRTREGEQSTKHLSQLAALCWKHELDGARSAPVADARAQVQHRLHACMCSGAWRKQKQPFATQNLNHAIVCMVSFSLHRFSWPRSLDSETTDHLMVHVQSVFLLRCARSSELRMRG